MIRFLAGLGTGLGAAAITSFFTHSTPWLLAIGGAAAVVVWLGVRALEAAADLIDELTS